MNDDHSQDVVVFVGGCDRSGTTIVSRLIAEHLGLVMLPEAYFHAVAFRRFGRDATGRQALRHWRRRSWDLDADDPRADTDLAEYLRAAMSDIQASRRGVRTPLRVVESTPENVEIGSLLLDGVPNAQLVHVVRDPRAVVASLKAADFGPTNAQSCARLWKQRLASGLALEMHRPERVCRVRYEDLIRDPAALPANLTSVLASSGHEYLAERDALLDPTSIRFQRRALDPVDNSRIESWREELTETEVGIIEYECRELMLALGYEPDGGHDPRTATRRLFSSVRSDVGELTVGSLRRLLRVTRARLRR